MIDDDDTSGSVEFHTKDAICGDTELPSSKNEPWVNIAYHRNGHAQLNTGIGRT